MISMYFRNVARYIMAVVFIFSGFVKAIDPLGSAYKFSDYFEAFGMTFLAPITLLLAILLSNAELLIGLCLFFRIRMKITSWALTIFMLFFTILTLLIALTDPVSDCGCFGDALILTNWQTFFKNLFFLVPTVVIFHQRNNFEAVFKIGIEWAFVGVLAVFGVLLSVYNLRNLPLLDFRPYRIGSNITEGMQVPEGKPVDEYMAVVVYEKEGIQKEFTLDAPEKPWNDSSWTWVETRNVLVKEGYKPPIHDFSLTSRDGDDITASVLGDPGYTWLIVACDLDKTDKEGLKEVNEFILKALGNGYRAYGMTASLSGIIDQTEKELDLDFEFYTTDDITLKTIVRANPGLILLKDGTVIGKWHFRNIPGDDFFSTQGMAYGFDLLLKKRNHALVAALIAMLCLAGLITFIFSLRKK